jgi:AcrR family transcriptional regulator
MSSSGGEPQTIERARQVLQDLGDVTELDPGLAPEQRLRAAMAAYFAYAEAHADDYRALHRGETAVLPEVRALVAEALELQAARLLAMLAPDVRVLEMVRFAVHGWFRYLVANCMLWLERPSVDREALSDVCVDTLFSAVAAATRAAAPDEAW